MPGKKVLPVLEYRTGPDVEPQLMMESSDIIAFDSGQPYIGCFGIKNTTFEQSEFKVLEENVPSKVGRQETIEDIWPFVVVARLRVCDFSVRLGTLIFRL